MSEKNEEEEQDRTPWVSVRISLSKNHRVLSLRDTIEDAPRNLRWEAMGAAVDLWLNTFIVAWADGDLTNWKPEDVEDMVHWKGKPGELIKSLKTLGFFEAGPGMKVAGWLKHQKRALRDRMRYYDGAGRKPPVRQGPNADSDIIARNTAAARAARRK